MKILHKDCWVSLAHHLSSVFFQCRQTLRNCTEYWPYLLKCLSGQDRNNVYLSNMALVWICSLFLIVSHLWRWWNAARRGRFWTFWHLHGCGQMTQEAPLQVAIRSVCWVCPSQYHNLEHDPIKDPYRVFCILLYLSHLWQIVLSVNVHSCVHPCVCNNVFDTNTHQTMSWLMASLASPSSSIQLLHHKVSMLVMLTLNSAAKHNHPDRRSHNESAVKGLACSCPSPIPTTIYQNLTEAEQRHSPTPGTWTSWTISKFL
jgi:hypothetical protein